MNQTQNLSSLSPLDGRYWEKSASLREYFSEKSLIKYRIWVEIIYLIELLKFLNIKRDNKRLEKKLIKFYKGLTSQDFVKVKNIEKKINHDVKAVEYFLVDYLNKINYSDIAPWVHWGLTSEDTNSLAYNLMLQNAKDDVIVPSQLQVLSKITDLSKRYEMVVMPGRTHGQIAVPTTIGKELIVYAVRIKYFLEKMLKLKLGGKLNGAVGNFNAYVRIYPEYDWISFSNKVIKKLGLIPQEVTTQIESSGRTVYFFDILRQINNVYLDLVCDMWLYISLDYFRQKSNRDHIGSSTMPHKVNPIDFENAEGNLRVSNGILATLSDSLPVSRLQRDLSGSTVRRNFGVGLGYSLIAVKSINRGLEKIIPNYDYLKNEVNSHPEMLSEAIQLYLKKMGIKDAYRKTKAKISDNNSNFNDLLDLISDNNRTEVQSWKPDKYIGLSKKITGKYIKVINKFIKEAV